MTKQLKVRIARLQTAASFEHAQACLLRDSGPHLQAAPELARRSQSIAAGLAAEARKLMGHSD